MWGLGCCIDLNINELLPDFNRPHTCIREALRKGSAGGCWHEESLLILSYYIYFSCANMWNASNVLLCVKPGQYNTETNVAFAHSCSSLHSKRDPKSWDENELKSIVPEKRATFIFTLVYCSDWENTSKTTLQLYITSNAATQKTIFFSCQTVETKIVL